MVKSVAPKFQLGKMQSYAYYSTLGKNCKVNTSTSYNFK